MINRIGPYLVAALLIAPGPAGAQKRMSTPEEVASDLLAMTAFANANCRGLRSDRAKVLAFMNTLIPDLALLNTPRNSIRSQRLMLTMGADVPGTCELLRASYGPAGDSIPGLLIITPD